MIGIALNPSSVREQIAPSADELKQLGAPWVRFMLGGQSQDLATGRNDDLDWLLNRYQPLGTKVLVFINHESLNTWPEAMRSNWQDAIQRTADLAAKVAARYANRIHALEVLNEPDNWEKPNTPRFDAPSYGALLREVYGRVKAVNPNLPVISAGVLDTGGAYLRQVVQAAPGKFDGVGLHPYAARLDKYPAPDWGPSGELRDIVQRARAIGGKPIWITEFGGDLHKYSWPNSPSPERGVAEYMKRAFNMFASFGADTVARVFWFTWMFPATGGEVGFDWGMVDSAGNRREAWFAFQQWAQQAEHMTNPINVQPTITKVSFTPPTVNAGDVLNVSVTVRNDSDQLLVTQGPPPGTLYEEADTFRSRNFGEVAGAYRVAVDYEGRTGALDHPYRWGLGAPLAPGQSATVTGQIRLMTPQVKKFWAGLVRETLGWTQNNQGVQAIFVQSTGTAAPLPQQVAALQAQVNQLQQKMSDLGAELNRVNAALAQIKQQLPNA